MKARPLIALCCIIFLFATSYNAILAQGYSILIQCPPSLSGQFKCTLFSAPNETSHQRASINNQEATFTGVVNSPCLMQITHPALPQPLNLFVENANIVIKLNTSSPNSSPITGSRINSRYRYALESHNPNYEPNWISNLINENPSEIFSPFILLQYQSDLPFFTLKQLFQQLISDATHTYHYQQLSLHLQQLENTLEGNTLPDFIFFDSTRHPIHFDSIRTQQQPTIILFSATWCQQCLSIAQQLHNNYPQLHTLHIPIDYHPKQWNAPYLEQLSINHIPYMILIDKNKKILSRDLRIWELPRLLKELHLNPSPLQP